jgi:nucleoside-diphosphate-sugar epimerase
VHSTQTEEETDAPPHSHSGHFDSEWQDRFLVTNQDLVAAIKEVIPEAVIELSSVDKEAEPAAIPYQDITRLVQDTGYRPQFTTTQAIADYTAWLRASNQYSA